MKISEESAEADRAEGLPAPASFTLESIRPVRDFTARKTLEQAHAFVEGIVRLFHDAGHDGGDPQTPGGDEEARRLAAELSAVGITAADAEQLALQAVTLIELMADRDHKADIFHAAVREAGQGERAMYERLAMLARLLRQQLGATAPALASFGVPPDLSEEVKAKAATRTPSRPIYSSATSK